MVERVQSKRRRRVMRRFKLGEISAVDSPAQAGATAVLMKRDDSTADERQEPDMRFEKITRGADAPETLEEVVRDIMRREGCSRLLAMEEVARKRPDLVRKYNEDGETTAKAAREAAAPRPVAKAVREFEKCVGEVRARDRCSKLEAMERAAREFPDELAAYQEA